MLIDLSPLCYPLPPDVQRLFEAGDFARMERVIALRLADPNTPAALADRLRFQSAIVRELPRAYPYTHQALLDELTARVRDFTPDELEQLRDDGTLDWRYIDGDLRFKDDCIENLFKTRLEYANRAIDPIVRESAKQRETQLDAVIARMRERGGMRLRFELHEEMTIRSDALTPGETLRVHLPLPVVDAQVRSGALLRSTHAAVHIAPEDALQRTACFELPYEPGVCVGADISYEIDARYIEPRAEAVSAKQPNFDTEEIPPHIVFTPYLRALAKEIVGEEQNPLLKARKIYDFITTRATYRYMPPYLTITNIPEYFLSGAHGDCGVQALTFITLCRLSGIPAQWQAGLYTTPDSAGDHDWARFYVAPYGWLFADCSFGGSAWRAGAMERFNFYFGNIEPWRLPLCRAFQQEFDPPKRFLRRDPYDNQDGEVETLTRALERREYQTSARVLSCEQLD